MGDVREKSGRLYIRWYDGEGVRRQESLPSTATRHDARRTLAEREAEAAQIRDGRKQPDRTSTAPAGDLMRAWLDTLVNRNEKIDRGRAARYLIPKWGEMRLVEITLPTVLAWIDELRRERPVPPPAPGDKRRRGRPKARLSEPSIRQNLNLLSRFFSWAVERGHATVNPVRLIPMGKRPRAGGRTDTPWLDDDATVRLLFNALPTPVNLMFYLGNRSGLRTGEAAGLRLSDLGFLGEGSIRVRFSYDGPLKEDKHNEGKVKWVPAPDDATDALGGWLARRRAEGAGPEDLVFVAPQGGTYGRVFIGRAWREAARAVGVTLTWYQGTRHSFVSRNLASGASLDEVSGAVGHSSPVVTRRYYDHFIRRTFSPTLRAGLGLRLDGADAPVIPLRSPDLGPQPGPERNNTPASNPEKQPKTRARRGVRKSDPNGI